jgi:serine/threonine protein kinase
MDIWSFGFILHKVIARDIPAFDPTRKPILNKSLFSPGMLSLVNRCLSLTPANRPSWAEINIQEIGNSIVVEEI